jgi:uncharacterized protein (TIRG00374 family)
VQIAIGFVISGLFVFILLREVSPEQLGQVLSDAQPLPMVAVALGVVCSLVTRAARWQVYFRPDRHVPFRPLLETLSISYMASTFLPLRAGELVRAVFLGARQSIPVPRVVGTILLEKLFDFLAIGVMLLVLVILTPTRTEVRVGGGSIAAVILVGFGFVVALAVWRTPTLRLVKLVETRLPLGLGRRIGLERAVSHFAEGTDSLRVPGLWVPLLGWTIVTWSFSLATAWAGCFTLGVEPGLPALLFLIVLTSSSQAVPSSPGYIGVYHYFAKLALTTFGVDATKALGIAIMTWVFSYGPLVVAGLIGLWTGGYTFGDVLSGVRGQRSSLKSAPTVAEPWPVAPDP